MSENHDESPASERGGDLLSRISTEMVRAQKKYYGNGPTAAKPYMLDDFLIIVMRDCQVVAEKTMIEFGQMDLVREFRQHFENEMTGKLVGMIEGADGSQDPRLSEPDHHRSRHRHRDLLLRSLRRGAGDRRDRARTARRSQHRRSSRGRG